MSSCLHILHVRLHRSMPWFGFLFEGIFIYPLEEGSVVVGFEAMISTQIITLQIKDKTKIEDCYVDYCTTTNGNLLSGNGRILCFAFKTSLKFCVVLTWSTTSFALLLAEKILCGLCKYITCSHNPSQSAGVEQAYCVLMNIVIRMRGDMILQEHSYS